MPVCAPVRMRQLEVPLTVRGGVDVGIAVAALVEEGDPRPAPGAVTRDDVEALEAAEGLRHGRPGAGAAGQAQRSGPSGRRKDDVERVGAGGGVGEQVEVERALVVVRDQRGQRSRGAYLALALLEERLADRDVGALRSLEERRDRVGLGDRRRLLRHDGQDASPHRHRGVCVTAAERRELPARRWLCVYLRKPCKP